MNIQREYRPVGLISRWMLITLMAAALALAAGCMPPPGPLSDESAAIGVMLEKRWSENGIPEHAERIYFIRWNEDSDPAKQNDIIESNYNRGGRVYLFNAKPGRYSAVAAVDFTNIRHGSGELWAGAQGREQMRGIEGYASSADFQTSTGQPRASFVGLQIDSGGGDRVDEFTAYATYFSEDLVKRSTVEVLPGEFTVMGKFQVMMQEHIVRGDRVQTHFYQSINPSLTDPRGMPIHEVQDTVSTRAHLIKGGRSGADRRHLLELALEDLRGTEWEQMIRRMIDRLR